MFGQSDSRDDYQPYGYLGRIPLYLTTILVILYVACMVTLVLFKAGTLPDFSSLLVYDSFDIRQSFQFWRFVTYPLVNGPTIWFAIEMYLLYSFGREVERFIGRRCFGMLYLTLVVLGPCLLTAVGTFTPIYFGLSGSQTVDFAVFIAFATIYPNSEIFFFLKAKWIAAVIIAIDSLQLLQGHAVVQLLVFWAACLMAFLFIKYLRGQISLGDYFRRRRSQRNLRVMPPPRQLPKNKPPTPRDDVIESIDPLLDKIARHGLKSLTDREKAKLEQAAAELKKPGP